MDWEKNCYCHHELDLKIIHHKKLLGLILSDSHSSIFFNLINQWLLWKLCYALRQKVETKRTKKRFSLWHVWSFCCQNFQAQKTTQERIIVERFSSSAPSTTTFTPKTVHAVISVIHEKVYDIIQIEVSRKKLESSTSVVSSSSKAETQRGKRQGILKIWWRRAKLSNQAAKTNIDIGWEERKSKFGRTKKENPNCALK